MCPQLVDSDLYRSAYRHEIGGNLNRAESLYQQMLRAQRDPVARATLLVRLAHVSMMSERWDEVQRYLGEAEGCALSARSPELHAEALLEAGIAHYTRGDFQRAISFFQEVLRISECVRTRGHACVNYALALSGIGQQAGAVEQLRQAQALYEEIAFNRGPNLIGVNRASVSLDAADYTQAASYAEETRARSIAEGEVHVAMMATLISARALWHLGEAENADRRALESLGHFQNSGHAYGISEAYLLLGDLAVERGDRDLAEVFFCTGWKTAASASLLPETERLVERLNTQGLSPHCCDDRSIA